MAELKAATRNALPARAFGLPGQRKYPMEDRAHQVAAKGRATQAVKAGRMSSGTAARIKAEANRLLKH